MKKVKMNKKEKQKISQAIRNSLVFGFLIIIANWINEKIVTSLTAKIFSSYDSISTSYEKSFTKKIISKLWLSAERKLIIKNKIQKSIETGIFYRSFLSVINTLVSVSARAYGVVFFMYGFFALSVGLIKTYVAPTIDNDYSLIYQGAILAFVSIPLLFVKKGIGHLLAYGKVTGFIIGEAIGIKKERVIRPLIQENTVIPMLIGLLLGVSSLFIRPIYVFFVFFVLVYVSVVFCYTEFGLMMLVATFPFVSIKLICAQIILTSLSLFVKLIRGKRSLTHGTLETCISAFLIIFLLGGVFSASPETSLKPAIIYSLLILVYFLVVNLVKNYDTLKKMLAFTAISFFFCTAYGVLQAFFSLFNHRMNIFLIRQMVISSTFESPELFAEYLIALVPLVLSFMIVEKGFKNKGRIAFIIFMGICALVFTWSKTAFLAFALTILIYLVVVNKKAVTVYIFCVFFIPIIYSFLPSFIKKTLVSFFSMDDFASLFSPTAWTKAFSDFGELSFTGVGVGADVQSLDGVWSAFDGANMYFQILFETGVIGLVLFFAVIFFAISKCFSRLKASENRRLRLISSASLMGVFAILIKGLADNTWYNYRIFLLFWILISTVSASAELCRNKEKYKINEEEIHSGGKNDKAEIEVQV